MPQVFNPPPNWPQPPAGWVPPPNWLPDRKWGPAPTGWQLWIEEAEKAPPSVRVFISYRRSDAQAQANGLYDGLSHRLPDAKIFMDIDSIPVGADFEQYIRGEIEVCDVVLVLIGDEWLAERPGSSVRRIDEPGDFVRLEIESAFASPRVRVIPVLIEDAQMPPASQMPPSLERLARLNAIELSDRRWKGDLERLTTFLRGAVEQERAEARREYAPRSLAVPKSDAPIVQAAQPTKPARSAYVPYAPPIPSPPPAPMPPPIRKRSGSGWGSEPIGWLMAALPLLCFGMAAFAPFLRAAMLRPHDRAKHKRLAAWAIALELAVIVSYVLVGTAPVDSEGVMTGVAGNLGAIMLLVAMVVAAVWGVVYRKAPAPE